MLSLQKRWTKARITELEQDEVSFCLVLLSSQVATVPAVDYGITDESVNGLGGNVKHVVNIKKEEKKILNCPKTSLIILVIIKKFRLVALILMCH